MGGRRNIAIGLGAAGFLATLLILLILRPVHAQGVAQPGSSGTYVGVATCGGTTCHGRGEADGEVVRQDELMLWQDPATAAGAHSRAWAVLREPRSQAIARRLGIGEAASAPMCLGCHATPAGRRGHPLPDLRRGRLRELPRPRLGLADQPLCGRRHPRRQRRARAGAARKSARPRRPVPRLPFRQRRSRPVRHPPDHGRRPPPDQLRARPVLDPAAAPQCRSRLCPAQGQRRTVRGCGRSARRWRWSGR